MTDRIAARSTEAAELPREAADAKGSSAKPEDVKAFEREMRRGDSQRPLYEGSITGREARTGEKGFPAPGSFAEADRARSSVLSRAAAFSQKEGDEGSERSAMQAPAVKNRLASGDDDGLDLLSQLFSQSAPVERETGPASVQAAAAEARLDREELEALTSRILVSVPDAEGHEVRLTLSEPPLEGTEICVRRDSLGQLSVTIIAGDPNAFQTLVEAQGDLAGSLQACERDPVSIRVEEETLPRDNDDGPGSSRP